MPELPWVFEPCSAEDATDPAGAPWAHAVRGRKPAGRLVTGYGHTPPAADADARNKAQQVDAREMLGERGELKLRLSTCWIDHQCMITVYDTATDTALLQGQVVVSDFILMEPMRMSGLGSVWPSTDFTMMPVGT